LALVLLHDGGDKLRIYRDGGKLVKLYLSAPYEYVTETARVQALLREAGLPVPAVYGVRRVSETETVLETAYIDSKPFNWPGMPESEWETGMRAVIELQCRIGAVDAAGFPAFTELLADEIRGTPYLAQETKARALDRMRQLDTGMTKLCHGDMHPGNVLFDGERYWVIDWGSASRGDPAADACMTYLYEKRFSPPGRADTYLRLFCMASKIEREAVLAWLPVIAAYQVNIKTEDQRAYILQIIDETLI
jgi:tRNA A-37 threonylcarbamoyl transferase component Bud32